MSGKKQSLDKYYADSAKRLTPKGDGQSESDHVTAPKVWKSSPKHPTAYLVYITAAEAKHLEKLDLHGSGVDKEMHFGPNGIPSYQGDGGSDGGGSDGGSSGGSEGASDSSDSTGTSDGSGGVGGDAGSDAGTSQGGGGASTDGGASGGGAAGSADAEGGDTSSGSEADGGSVESLFGDLVAVTAFAQERERDAGPRQFETREQGATRRATAAGAKRVDNDADLLGYSRPRVRRGQARRTLGSR